MSNRMKDGPWDPGNTEKYGVLTWERVQVAILMDIRDELKQLNRLLHCPNFVGIPGKLEKIRKNTAKPREIKQS